MPPLATQTAKTYLSTDAGKIDRINTDRVQKNLTPYPDNPDLRKQMKRDLAVQKGLGSETAKKEKLTLMHTKRADRLQELERNRLEQLKRLGIREDQSAWNTIWDTIGLGAGEFDKPIVTVLDAAANLLPMAEGFIMGEDPDATFTGQVLRPITTMSGWLKDYIYSETERLRRQVMYDTRNNPIAREAVNFTSDLISVAPTVGAAIATAGASAAPEIGARLAVPASNTVASALRGVVDFVLNFR